MPKTQGWKQFASKKFPVDLATATAASLKEALETWSKSTEYDGRVSRSQVMGQVGTAWGVCKCRKGCKVTFRWDLISLAAEPASELEATWFVQGEHPVVPPDAEESRSKEERARKVSHLRPMQAHAHLLGQDAPRETMPTVKDHKIYFFRLFNGVVVGLQYAIVIIERGDSQAEACVSEGGAREERAARRICPGMGKLRAGDIFIQTQTRQLPPCLNSDISCQQLGTCFFRNPAYISSIFTLFPRHPGAEQS